MQGCHTEWYRLLLKSLENDEAKQKKTHLEEGKGLALSHSETFC